MLDRNQLSIINKYCSELLYLLLVPHPEISEKQSKFVAHQASEYVKEFYKTLINSGDENIPLLRTKWIKNINRKLTLANTGNLSFYLQACDLVLRELLFSESTDKVDETLKGLYYYKDPIKC